jgi:translation initiation factor IF-2
VPTSFSALAGSGCPARSDAGTTVTQGWYNQSGGGWTGSGCSGAYVSKWDHPASYNEYRTFLWWFNPTLTGHVTCRVSVYIPSGSTTTVGSNPARYTVYTGPNGHAVGSFRINQRTHHARWVYEGTYPEQEKRFSVQVNNLGSGSVMVAADAVRVTCTH